MIGFMVLAVSTAPAQRQRLGTALGGPGTPSRHIPSVWAATAPLAQSPRQGFSDSNTNSAPGDKGKEAMETDVTTIGNDRTRCDLQCPSTLDRQEL